MDDHDGVSATRQEWPGERGLVTKNIALDASQRDLASTRSDLGTRNNGGGATEK